MKRKVDKRFHPFILIASIIAGIQFANAKDLMKITRQVDLASGNPAWPLAMIRASNGDYVIAGGNTAGAFALWAERVNGRGDRVWEFLDGNNWKDQSVPHHRLVSLVELADTSILFCGLYEVGRVQSALLLHMSADGAEIQRRLIAPKYGGSVVDLKCVRWGDDVALVGGLVSNPDRSWLVLLNKSGDIIFENTGPYYYAMDAIEADDGALLLASPRGLSKINREGVVIANYPIRTTVDYVHFMRKTTTTLTSVRIAYMESTLKTVLEEFDFDLKPVGKPVAVENVGVHTGFSLADGSSLIFGSAFHGQATGQAALVDRNGHVSRVSIEKSRSSPFFVDAVPSEKDGEFVAIGTQGSVAVLSVIDIE